MCENQTALACFDSALFSCLPTTFQVQMDGYLESWYNYCRLFDMLLDCRDTNLVITEAWAFDLIHEFVYQFQSFCQMRGQVSTPDLDKGHD
ncbi:unnamed protein product, partial [Sphacelaria rigidula]